MTLPIAERSVQIEDWKGSAAPSPVVEGCGGQADDVTGD
jgi:hypothetical protein